MPKPLAAWIPTNCGKFFGRWEYQITSPASWETCMQVKKQTVKTGHGTTTSSKLGKEYVNAVFSHLAHLTYTQRISCEMPGWMKIKLAREHKLESRFPGEISITSYMQMTLLLWKKEKRNYRVSWWSWKKRVEKLAENSILKKKKSNNGNWSHHFK